MNKTKLQFIKFCEQNHGQGKRDTTFTHNNKGYYVWGGCAEMLRTTKGNAINLYEYVQKANYGGNK